MSTYMPPGWPAGVHPPGTDDFESTAVGWLLDVVPPDYRLHGVLRRYPVALATMARYHSRACVEGARQGYRTARTELAGVLPPHAIDTVLAAYRKEGARLAATARAVSLVERALRGEDLTPAPIPEERVPLAPASGAGGTRTREPKAGREAGEADGTGEAAEAVRVDGGGQEAGRQEAGRQKRGRAGNRAGGEGAAGAGRETMTPS
jgi:hypothetical protein